MTTSPSEEEAALKVKANQAGAEVAETVRREPSFRAQSLSSDHTASAHRMHALLSTTARTVAAGRLYGFIRLTAHARER